MDLLARIKRLVFARRVAFTAKANDELAADGLREEDVFEALLNAPAINKVIRSRRPFGRRIDMLYVIKGLTFDGLLIYTKGKIIRRGNDEVFYILISSKRSTDR